MTVKRLIISVIILSASMSLYAADVKTIDIDTSGLRGKMKAGVSLGYPTGLTAGYRFADPFEMNCMLVTD